MKIVRDVKEKILEPFQKVLREKIKYDQNFVTFNLIIVSHEKIFILAKNFELGGLSRYIETSLRAFDKEFISNQ